MSETNNGSSPAPDSYEGSIAVINITEGVIDGTLQSQVLPQCGHIKDGKFIETDPNPLSLAHHELGEIMTWFNSTHKEIKKDA